MPTTAPWLDDLPVRIVADDLTGALDAAAPFARPDRPVGLVLDPSRVPARRTLTISSESRGVSAKNAVRATRDCCDALKDAAGATDALWFHKVDSVLRGHPAATTAAMMKHLGFDHCFFAPAFPAMGRITRSGMHLVLHKEGSMPAAIPEIGAALRAVGITVGEGPGALHALLPDVETQEQMNDAVVACTRTGPLLWVGSRGLAEALAGPVASFTPLPLGAVIVGTAHPATRAQIAFAKALLSAAAETGALRAVEGSCLLVDPVPGAVDADATRTALVRMVERLDAASLQGAPLLVVGGDTLSAVLSAAGAVTVDCIGEVGPGLPLSRVGGGSLDRTMLISKSGGFGAIDLIHSLAIGAPEKTTAGFSGMAAASATRANRSTAL